MQGMCRTTRPTNSHPSQPPLSASTTYPSFGLALNGPLRPSFVSASPSAAGPDSLLWLMGAARGSVPVRASGAGAWGGQGGVGGGGEGKDEGSPGRGGRGGRGGGGGGEGGKGSPEGPGSAPPTVASHLRCVLLNHMLAPVGYTKKLQYISKKHTSHCDERGQARLSGLCICYCFIMREICLRG